MPIHSAAADLTARLTSLAAEFAAVINAQHAQKEAEAKAAKAEAAKAEAAKAAKTDAAM